MRDKRWKYIRWNMAPAEEELYDLQADPQEHRNLAGDPAHAAELARLRARLAELRTQYDDTDPLDFAPVAQKPITCPA